MTPSPTSASNADLIAARMYALMLDESALALGWAMGLVGEMPEPEEGSQGVSLVTTAMPQTRAAYEAAVKVPRAIEEVLEAKVALREQLVDLHADAEALPDDGRPISQASEARGTLEG